MKAFTCKFNSTIVAIFIAASLFFPSLLLAQDTDGDGLKASYEIGFTPVSFSCMAGDNCASVSGCTRYAYNGHNYLYCTTGSNWQTALDFCRNYGGDLAAVADAAEETEIESHLVDQYHYWIGGNDLDVEDTFAYSHGTAFSYTDWNTGQPEAAGPDLDDCVRIYDFDSGAGTTNFKWADSTCGQLMRFVCEDNFGLNPLMPDSDEDGFGDNFEARYPSCLQPLYDDSLSGNIDGDSLTNQQERDANTNPCAADTDSDGLSDYAEANYPPTEFTCLAGDSCASLSGCTLDVYGGHNYLFCSMLKNWADAPGTTAAFTAGTWWRWGTPRRIPGSLPICPPPTIPGWV